MIDGLRKIIIIGLSFGAFCMMSQIGYAAETPDTIIEKTVSLSESDTYKSEGRNDEEGNGSGKPEVVVAENHRDPLSASFIEIVTTPSCWSTSTKICVGVATGVAIGALITYFYMNSKNDGIVTKPPYDPDAARIKLVEELKARAYLDEKNYNDGGHY